MDNTKRDLILITSDLECPLCRCGEGLSASMNKKKKFHKNKSVYILHTGTEKKERKKM